MSRRFSSMSGLASWLGNVPSIVKHSLVVRHGRRSNIGGATRPAIPLPASRTTVNGLMIAGSMNDITFSTYGETTSRVVSRPGRCGGRRQAIAGDHVADVADAGVAAERQRLGAHHLDAVVLLRIVRRGDLRAAFEAVVDDREVHHVGRQHAVVHDVRALLADAVDERRGNRRRRHAHVARDADLRRRSDTSRSRGRSRGRRFR